MKAFLITSAKGISEWKHSITELQEEMNLLEKSGFVANVKIQHFADHKLINEMVYDWNGTEWERK